jgi:hypothetical protein
MAAGPLKLWCIMVRDAETKRFPYSRIMVTTVWSSLIGSLVHPFNADRVTPKMSQGLIQVYHALQHPGFDDSKLGQYVLQINDEFYPYFMSFIAPGADGFPNIS